MRDLKERYQGRLEVRFVSPDTDKELFRQYKIMLVPTQVFLDTGGQEVFRHVGAWSRDEVLQKLRDLKFISE
jgi:thioredoxin 1